MIFISFRWGTFKNVIVFLYEAVNRLNRVIFVSVFSIFFY